MTSLSRPAAGWQVSVPHLGVRIASACAIAGGVCALIPLFGWMLGAPLLRTFVPGAAHLWPMSSIGFVALAAAFAARLRGQRGLAAVLLVVPFLLGATAAIEHLTGWISPLDLLLFPDAVRRAVVAGVPGRPGYVAIASFLLLSLGIALANRPSERTGQAVVFLASFTLAVAVLSVAIVLLNLTAGSGRALGMLSTPVPSGLAAIALGIGLLAWRAESGWVGLLVTRGAGLRILRLAFPLILLLPLLTTVVELDAVRRGADPLVATVVAASVNVLIFSALLFWTATRSSQDRAALEEVTRALDSAPVAITDPDGLITHWSQGCEDLYGFTAEEAVGRNKHELLRTRPNEAFVGAVGESWTETRRDGSLVYVIERARTLTSRTREPAIVLAMTDISRGIEMQAELRSSREQLAAAVESHQVGVFEWDVATGTLAWTAGSEERLGLEPGSLKDWATWETLVDKGDLAKVRATREATTAVQGERFPYYYRLRQPSGGVRSIEGSARLFYDAAGAFTRSVGVAIDVTLRDEREAMLADREAQLRAVLDTVPDAVVVTDRDGTIAWFSRAAEILFGRTAADVQGRNIGALGRSEDGRGEDLAARLPEAAGQALPTVLSLVGAGGEAIPVELRVCEAGVGENRLFTAFLRDIREPIAAEERLHALRTEMAHLARLGAMGEMAAGLAHELNQPLAATVNFLATAEMLLENGGAEQATDMVDMAKAQALRAGDIIRRMRGFASRQEPEVRAESVEGTIRDAAALVLVGHGQFAVQLDYSFDPEATLMFADRVQVQQVLVNLLRNAVEAMREAGTDPMRIEIATQRLDDMIEVRVSDNGPGLPQDVLARDYSPFISTKEGAGMGLGLSICRRIVEAHGGALRVENAPEGGACFRFTLPLINEEELGEA